MLTVGIVGMGGMGWQHARRYPHLPQAQVTAIADLIPERLAPRAAVETNVSDGAPALLPAEVARYGEGLDLIREAAVDVVDICLPTYLHADYAIAALEAGRHVICEKPMALNAEDADRMVAAVEKTGRRLMIAQVVRFWPAYEHLADLTLSERYGALQSLNLWRVGGRPGWSPDNWFLDPALSGGAILDLHVHDVDYANAVFGMPASIYCTGRQTTSARAYDVVHACFNYPDGPQVHMHAGWAAGRIPFTAGFEAWFDAAFVRYTEGVLQVFPEDGEPLTPAFASPDAYLNEIAYFLDCVSTDQAPTRCTPASTCDTLVLIDKELASADAGKVVLL
jgi:predicted dehydrogenase